MLRIQIQAASIEFNRKYETERHPAAMVFFLILFLLHPLDQVFCLDLVLLQVINLGQNQWYIQ